MISHDHLKLIKNINKHEMKREIILAMRLSKLFCKITSMLYLINKYTDLKVSTYFFGSINVFDIEISTKRTDKKIISLSIRFDDAQIINNLNQTCNQVLKLLKKHKEDLKYNCFLLEKLVPGNSEEPPFNEQEAA